MATEPEPDELNTSRALFMMATRATLASVNSIRSL